MNKPSENKSSLKFFGIGKMLPFLKKYRGMMLTMVLCGAAGSIIDIGTPLLQRYALNHFVGLGTLDTLAPFILMYVFVILFAGVSNFFSAKTALWLEVRLDRDLRNAAFEHLQTLSFSYYSQNSVGYIHSRVMSDTSRIGALFSWTIIDSVWQGAYVIGAIVAMLIVNARLALLVLTILPLLVVLFSVFQKKLVRINREIREINSKITGNFNEGITGAKTVKTLVIEDRIEHDFKAETDNMLRRSVRAARLRGYRPQRGRNLLDVHVLCPGHDGAHPLAGGRLLRFRDHAGQHRASDKAARNKAGRERQRRGRRDLRRQL